MEREEERKERELDIEIEKSDGRRKGRRKKTEGNMRDGEGTRQGTDTLT